MDLLESLKNYELYIESLQKYSYLNKEIISVIEEAVMDYADKSSLSEKSYYEKLSRVLSLMYTGIIPLRKMMSFVSMNKISISLDFVFDNKYNIEPITYNTLFDFLSSLSNSDMLYVIDKMGLSLNVYNGVYEALQSKSKEKFLENLSSETKDLRNVFRQLNALYLHYQIFVLVQQEENASDINIYSLVEVYLKLYDRDSVDTFYRFFDKYLDNGHLQLLTSNEDSNHSLDTDLDLDYLLSVSKIMFFFILLDRNSLSLDRNEEKIINGFIDDIIDTFKEFDLHKVMSDYSELLTIEVKSDVEFVIPEDFFYSSLYSCNDDESYFYNVYDSERRGYSSIVQDFINDLALNGYIADVYNTKAVLLYRLSGRKLPEVNVVKIEWLKEVNAMLHLIKYFYKVLGSGRERLEKGIYNKIEKFISCKDFEIMTSYDRLKNPSNLAENIRATSYSSIFQIFENRIKQSKLKL